MFQAAYYCTQRLGMSTFSLFVSCPRGLEQPLANELAALGAADIRISDGGAACSGDLSVIYRINLHARTASRVLLRLVQNRFRNENDIYTLARNVDWPHWFGVDKGFKIHIEGKRAKVASLNFAALKVKDALCDVFRETTGARPDVQKIRPDVRIQVFIEEQNLAIYLDTSGEALFKRGYRTEAGEAPMRENLAAGLLLLAGYDGSQPFMDPFCGSGTLAIEAALIATRHAPGLHRSFGFERLDNFDTHLWDQLRKQAEASIGTAPAPIVGSDIDRFMIRTAKANAEYAGLTHCIDWQVADVLDVRPQGEHGILISNPPYGVRLSEIQILQALYPQLGSWLKQYFAGWRVGMFTADRDMPKMMRLTPKRKYPLHNGNLDCRLFVLDMVAGSNRGSK